MCNVETISGFGLFAVNHVRTGYTQETYSVSQQSGTFAWETVLNCKFGRVIGPLLVMGGFVGGLCKISSNTEERRQWK